jgi:hypothetical protein
MQTRSQTIQPLEKIVPNQPLHIFAPLLQKVDIDFDDATRAWKMNKKSIGNGCYKYICIKITKTGKQCKNDSLRNCEYCRYHNN